MARLVSLSPRALASRIFVAGLACLASAAFAAPAPPAQPSAKPAATNAAPVKPAGSLATTKPLTNAAPVLPPAMQNTLNRYGNIVTPGDQVQYPLKLRLPSPSDSEIRVPKLDDLDKRQKLEALARLSDADIVKQLTQWPAYTKMSLRDQANMLQRIQDFRDYHARVAQKKAHDMGLLTLTPDQRVKFETEYWNKRLKLDQDLVKQFQPIYQAREQKMDDELFREFSSAMPAPAAPPAPKPPAPPANKPPQPPRPVATAVPVTTNAASHVAQAPH